jgi:hypothetical protein
VVATRFLLDTLALEAGFIFKAFATLSMSASRSFLLGGGPFRLVNLCFVLL